MKLNIRHDQQHLFAAIPARNIFRANIAKQVRAQRLQHRIARFMAVLVIKPLEMVNIEHDHADRAVMPLRPQHLALEPLFHVAPVVQAGQWIVNRLDFQLFPQAQIGERERVMIREAKRRRVREILHRTHLLDFAALQHDDAHRLALREHGNAAGRLRERVRQMGATLARPVRHGHMSMPLRQRAAGLFFEILWLERRMSPRDGHANRLAAEIKQVDAPDRVGKQLLIGAGNQRKRVRFAGACLQFRAHLVQDGKLLHALLLVRHGDFQALMRVIALQQVDVASRMIAQAGNDFDAIREFYHVIVRAERKGFGFGGGFFVDRQHNQRHVASGLIRAEIAHERQPVYFRHDEILKNHRRRNLIRHFNRLNWIAAKMKINVRLRA